MKVAFYKGTRPGLQGIYNRLVRWWTRGPYSHCELVLAELPHGSLCASSSFIDGGVRTKVIELDPARWDVVTVRADSRRAHAWLTEHERDGYDLLGMFGVALRPLGEARRKWFCNEAVGAMLGVPDAWRFCPTGLACALQWAPGSGGLCNG